MSTCTGGAQYQGNAVQTAPSTPPSTIDLTAFFDLPSGAASLRRAADASRPQANPSDACSVTGTFVTGSGLTGQVIGFYDSANGGTFSGTLITTGVNGCTASTNYTGPMTTAGIISWSAGARAAADTCGSATPLTFTVAANLVNVQPPPTSVPPPTVTSTTTTTVCQNCNTTTSTSTTTALLNPQLTVTSAGSGQASLAGANFTPNGGIAMMFANRGNLSNVYPMALGVPTADAHGAVSIAGIRLGDFGDFCADHNYTCPSADFDVWVIDSATGRSSNHVLLTSHSYLPAQISVTSSGPPFAAFTGTGFSPNGTFAVLFANQGAAGQVHLFNSNFGSVDGQGKLNTNIVLTDFRDTCLDDAYYCPSDNYDVWFRDNGTLRDSNHVTLAAGRSSAIVNPQISVTPSSGPLGTTFTVHGTGFIPAGAVALHSKLNGGPENITDPQQHANPSGAITAGFTVNTPQTNEVWFVDDGSQISSNHLFFSAP